MPVCELHETFDNAIQDHEVRIRDLEKDNIENCSEIKGLREDINTFLEWVKWAIKWLLGILGTIAGSLIVYLVIRALGG